jgi:hypothetical protein
MAERPARLADGVRRPRRLLGVTGAVAVAALAAGCAAVPSAGPVRSAPAPPGGSGTNCCGLIMSGPKPNWSPTQIVSGFLLASASFAHDNAIARQYLTPSASRSWLPGSEVTIVDQAPKVIAQPRRLGPGSEVTVVASGTQVATLNSSGQYLPVAPGDVAAQDQNFPVTRYHGEWRIASLPETNGRVSRQLLLPEGLFNLVYKPQNLYFYAQGASSPVLVPDPVFVPSESSDPKTNDPATMLVRDLLSGPPEWLAGAVDSAFPAGTRLRGVQVLPGTPGTKTAIVSLSTPPHGLRGASVRAMDAQLVWTLTSQSYAQPLIQSVKLKVNGHFWPRSGSEVLTQADYQHDLPQPGSEDPYFVGGSGGIRVLTDDGQRAGAVRGGPVPGPAGTSNVSLSRIAISPDRSRLAGVGGPGSTVYVSNLAAAGARGAKPSAGAPKARMSGTWFGTPSWDSAGNLWVAGRRHGQTGIWLLPQGAKTPWPVTLSARLGRITALRVAPDGVRVVMITGKGAKARLRLGAVVRTGTSFAILRTLPLAPNLAGPFALSWYDSDHLLVATKSPAGTQLWEVPVNGDAAVRQGAPQQGIVSIAAAGPRNPLYLGLSSGRLERSQGFGEFWSDVTAGRDVAYPG